MVLLTCGCLGVLVRLFSAGKFNSSGLDLARELARDLARELARGLARAPEKLFHRSLGLFWRYPSIDHRGDDQCLRGSIVYRRRSSWPPDTTVNTL